MPGCQQEPIHRCQLPSIPPFPPWALCTESGWSGAFWILFQGPWALGQKCLAWASGDGSWELKENWRGPWVGWGQGDHLE